RVVREYSDGLLAADYQPVAVYINGKYWGLFNLREKINNDYLGLYEGLDGENVDIIKQNSILVEGSTAEYRKLVNYLKSHNMENDEYYEYVCTQVDIDNSIEYVIFESFFRNWDAPNIRVYRERTEGSKWRWIVYDMDLTLSSEANEVSLTAFEKNMQADAIISQLLKNPTYRDKLLKRYAELLNSAFLPENLLPIVDDMASEIGGEIERNDLRWRNQFLPHDRWTQYVDTMKDILAVRREVVIEEIVGYFHLSDEECRELSLEI
ncbi:MAG: CotH kinase family protein, partial [Clostridia bacterium]|nr:CotH kinase family protein [Clostridia bacterium]